MIAGPRRERMGAPRVSQSADDIAIRIEDADRRHVGGGETLLAACLAQQRLRREHRGSRGGLMIENGRLSHVVFVAANEAI
jgi:hypothetical protein